MKYLFQFVDMGGRGSNAFLPVWVGHSRNIFEKMLT